MEPISPNGVPQRQLPDFVIEAFNDEIAKRFHNGTAIVPQSDVVASIIRLAPEVDRETIFREHWLDVERLYESKGWKVRYDKPGYNETGDATFTFKAEK